MREVLRFLVKLLGLLPSPNKHLGVSWGIVDPVFKVGFGDFFVNFTHDGGVRDWAFE